MKIDIDENIHKISEHMNELRNELLRLEGSLRTLHEMKSMGLNEFDVKNKDLIENREVLDGPVQN
tara:strand:+ start:3780 stop:3974 length:195 start_codon:yes stop_codon:yes gene_type:complete